MLLSHSRAIKTEKGKHWVACLITAQKLVMQRQKQILRPALKMNPLHFVLKANLCHSKTYFHRVCYTVRITLILPTTIKLKVTYLGLQSGIWLMQTPPMYTNETNLYQTRLYTTNTNLWILKIVLIRIAKLLALFPIMIWWYTQGRKLYGGMSLILFRLMHWSDVQLCPISCRFESRLSNNLMLQHGKSTCTHIGIGN